MYEDRTPTVRRLLWAGLSLIIVVALIWLVVWLIFFRHPSSNVSQNNSGSNNHKTSTPSGGSTHNSPAPSGSSSTSPSSGSHSTTNSSNPSGTGSSSGSGTNHTSTDQSAGSGSGANSSQLANTGPGDVIAPVIATVVVGSAVYYVRLQRKLNT